MIEDQKILINSVPKSGTYLIGKLLEGLGIAGGDLHFRNGHYWDWSSAASVDEYIRNAKQFRAYSPLEESIGLVRQGYFYGHLDFDEATRLLLEQQDVSIHFFLIRELREAMVSMYRFQFHQSGREEPAANRSGAFTSWMTKGAANFLIGVERQTPWVDHCSLCIDYSALIGDKGPDAQNVALSDIAQILGVDGDRVAQAFHQSAVGQKTRTYTGRPSRCGEYWSDTAEEIFRSHGGDKINALLGFMDK